MTPSGPLATSVAPDAFQATETGVLIPNPRWGNRWASNQDTLLNVVCVGDSTVQGTGTNDPWPNRLRRRLGREASPQGFQGWGYRPLWNGEWSFGANWTIIPTSDISDQSPFGPGGIGGIGNVGGVQNLTGGTTAANIMTWTRPANMPVSLIRLFFTDPSALSAGIAYSVNGGTTWIAIPVNNIAAAPCRTFDITIANPATLQIAAATVAGGALSGASIVRGILGIATYSATQVPSRTVQDLVTNGTTAVTSGQAYFTVADNGATINKADIPLGTTLTFVSTTSATLSVAATGSSTSPATILGPNVGAVVHNMGKAGDFAFELDRATTGANKWAVIDSINPDLIVYGPFSNDMTIGNVATYQQNLSDMVAHFPQSDVLVLGCFEQSGGRDVPTQNNFRSALQAQAVASGAAFLDLRACWGTFAAANAAGLMNDILHESQLGANDIAARVARLLRVFS